jgi:hypothetical protein
MNTMPGVILEATAFQSTVDWFWLPELPFELPLPVLGVLSLGVVDGVVVRGRLGVDVEGVDDGGVVVVGVGRVATSLDGLILEAAA